MSGFETRRAVELEAEPEQQRWLIEHLWAERAVGIVGGEPKCCKSFLALDVAVAVATGTPCLRRFAVARPGPVLLFAAEDALHVVRQRLAGIALAAGRDLAGLDVHVITAPAVRLDLDRDRRRLRASVESIGPRLLVLDPFVRLHRVDENAAAEVAPMLAYLRELERGLGTAVLLVHHARKSGHARAGQALRGTSELHAWGDSNLYLRRRDDRLMLAAEHRAAPSGEELALELAQDGEALALRTVEAAEGSGREQAAIATAEDRVEQALVSSGGPMTVRQLREACRIRTATLCDVLALLVEDGRVVHGDAGYRLA